MALRLISSSSVFAEEANSFILFISYVLYFIQSFHVTSFLNFFVDAINFGVHESDELNWFYYAWTLLSEPNN